MEGSRAPKGGSSLHSFQDYWCEVTDPYGILYKKEQKQQAVTVRGACSFLHLRLFLKC